MEGTPYFKHQRLETPRTFRLVVLPPGQYDDQLECTVVNLDLDQCSKAYDAVSYVWGSKEDKATILCGHVPFQNAPFHITRNLEAFLRRYRHQSNSRVLWVDSICIDQTDLAELGNQVKLMGEIYRRAFSVVVWMGEEEPDSNFAALIRGAKLLYNLFPRNDEILAWTDIGRGTEGPVRNYDQVQAQFGLPDIDAEEFIALDKFWRNPWFNRAWTFQESILASQKRFSFGFHMIDGHFIIGAYLTSVMLNFATDSKIFFDANTARNLIVLTVGGVVDESKEDEVEPNTDLLCLLYRRRGAQCQRPCDLIYALLGLIDNKIGFKPDYAKDFGYIFAEVALDIINHRGDLQIFNQAHQTDVASELPSWVPDWRLDPETYDRSKSPFGFADIHLYRCTGSSRPLCSMSHDGRKLTIRGQEADRIYSMDPFTLKGNANLPEFVFQHLDFPLINGEYMYNSDEELEEAVVRILCCDINYPERPKRGYGQRWSPATHEAFVNVVENHRNGTDVEGVPALQVRMRDQVGGCQYIITDGGRMGIAPKHAQVGDIITLMLGGRVPLVLRECGDEYTFVGECYVDQIMDGELFDKPYLLPPSRDFVLI